MTPTILEHTPTGYQLRSTLPGDDTTILGLLGEPEGLTEEEASRVVELLERERLAMAEAMG